MKQQRCISVRVLRQMARYVGVGQAFPWRGQCRGGDVFIPRSVTSSVKASEVRPCLGKTALRFGTSQA